MGHFVVNSSKMSRLLTAFLLVCLLGLALGAPQRPNPLGQMGNFVQQTTDTMFRPFRPMIDAGNRIISPVMTPVTNMFGGILAGSRRFFDGMGNAIGGMFRS